MNIQQRMVPVSTEMAWAKIAKTCSNPFGLTDTTVQDSLESCPPIEYEGGIFLGRYIIPDTFVRYNPEDQPRDKSNDIDHVNDLKNSYEVQGYLTDAHPPIASLDDESIDPNHLRGQSGFNRKEARVKFGQELAIYDVYEWDSPYWELVARNTSNHHQNPQLSQTKNDYLKVVVSAVAAKIIPADPDAIDKFVDKIATDKTSKIRLWIKKNAYNNCGVYPNFRTYSSTGKGKNTLTGFMQSQGYPKQGIEGREDKDIQEQGCITYCSGEGDNLRAWARGIQYGTNKDVTVWVFGYAPNRVPDLKKFRQNWIKDFNDMKQTFITFASNIAGDGETVLLDEEDFPVRFAGFLPQYVKPSAEDQGKPTEHTLVDIDGNKIKFDPDGDCLASLETEEETE
tara:strand:+ start:149 stop:1336 length:1188 start_codon:yes stop_codon:yes gene_type:complete